MEKTDEMKQRITRAKSGMTRGVLIHFKFQVRLFSIKSAVKAMRVIK